jgi:outer membrane protein OmpA-like peptidoglycan-associated protein
MGGYDVFKATFNPATNEWSEPVNLGYPINTPDDDIYFVMSKDGKRAYYSSVREDGMGYTDIYTIAIPEGIKDAVPMTVAKTPTEPQPVDTTTSTPVVVTPPPTTTPPATTTKSLQPLKYVVSVVDASDQTTPLPAKIKLVGAKDNVIVPFTPLGDGMFEFNITNSKPKDYRLSVEVDGYVFQNINVKLQGASAEGKTVNRKVAMRKLVAGVTSILRNIYFDFDKATFKTESYTELNKLEAMLSQNQNIVMEIAGHTDAVGTKAYNQYLSLKRAQAVKDYLTKKGISTRRIKAVGYGKSKPLASNDDEQGGRELNRRVEFKVLQN